MRGANPSLERLALAWEEITPNDSTKMKTKSKQKNVDEQVTSSHREQRLVRRGRGHEYKLWVYDGPKTKPRFLAGITFDRRNPPNKTELARWERAIQAGLDAEFNSPPNVNVDSSADEKTLTKKSNV